MTKPPELYPITSKNLNNLQYIIRVLLGIGCPEPGVANIQLLSTYTLTYPREKQGFNSVSLRETNGGICP